MSGNAEIKRRGMLFVLSSPSGAGKTSVSRKVLAENDNIAMSVSVTTRPRRPGEEHGRDYYFIDQDTFAQMTLKQELLEHAQVFDYHYGTPRAFVEENLNAGRDVLFDIDWQGTRQLERTMRKDMISVFILPPSMAELESRLRTRAQDSEDVVQHRMSKAGAEISHWDEYDYVVVNREFEDTIDVVNAILKAERHKRRRQPGLYDFVTSLSG